jgi:hypothetical protein
MRNPLPLPLLPSSQCRVEQGRSLKSITEVSGRYMPYIKHTYYIRICIKLCIIESNYIYLYIHTTMVIASVSLFVNHVIYRPLPYTSTPYTSRTPCLGRPYRHLVVRRCRCFLTTGLWSCHHHSDLLKMGI